MNKMSEYRFIEHTAIKTLPKRSQLPVEKSCHKGQRNPATKVREILPQRSEKSCHKGQRNPAIKVREILPQRNPATKVRVNPAIKVRVHQESDSA